jgi:hypothetical protein
LLTKLTLSCAKLRKTSLDLLRFRAGVEILASGTFGEGVELSLKRLDFSYERTVRFVDAEYFINAFSWESTTP